ncbi:homocysteine-responsive endoplasmic reticulum-resident ubiquitin-like domain member 1 protein [Paralichthys olivaceus]|uniref:homocysteine-responsive endoplasmic reticulum-resident ubiquitin-like domain member 1 protein n=1 Tax=Paralichthys olivaceus TaxID=8255 RepID=UPI00097DFB3E|nr:PREDICTED: homocysteine-responsive endoplasmic reticulum-resident ubiquitin-like domain member 1 protein [Paralichthys olivaceus]
MDGADSGPETIRVLIKTPNQVREDQVLEDVHPGWTVRDLKTRLSAVYATRPAVRDQRLIYAGKLLPDHLHIRDIFRRTDSMPALHLVCAFKNPPQEPLGLTPKSTETEHAPPSSPRRTAPSPSSSSTVQTPSSPELRQRRPTSSAAAAAAAPAHTQTPASPPWSPAWPPAAMPGAPQITQPTFPTYSLYSPQQLLWLQHVYARQYYMQYHAALVAAGSAPSPPASVTGQFPPVPAHQVPVPAPLANQNPIDNLPANQNPAQDGAFINPGDANQNMRMNAQGGAVMEDEDAVERDWLDWLYSAARFCVLLMIVYFNSNLSRFLMVTGTLLLMYLHTAGLFPFRRRQVQDPDHLQPPEVQHNQQNENRIPNPDPAVELADREEPAAAADGPDEQGPMAAVLVPAHRVSVMWTAWVFFKTFFSSLIPEAPRGVAN